MGERFDRLNPEEGTEVLLQDVDEVAADGCEKVKAPRGFAIRFVPSSHPMALGYYRSKRLSWLLASPH